MTKRYCDSCNKEAVFDLYELDLNKKGWIVWVKVIDHPDAGVDGKTLISTGHHKRIIQERSTADCCAECLVKFLHRICLEAADVASETCPEPAANPPTSEIKNNETNLGH